MAEEEEDGLAFDPEAFEQKTSSGSLQTFKEGEPFGGDGGDGGQADPRPSTLMVSGRSRHKASLDAMHHDEFTAETVQAMAKAHLESQGARASEATKQFSSQLTDKQAKRIVERSRLFTVGEKYYHNEHHHGVVTALEPGGVVVVQFDRGIQRFGPLQQRHLRPSALLSYASHALWPPLIRKSHSREMPRRAGEEF